MIPRSADIGTVGSSDVRERLFVEQVTLVCQFAFLPFVGTIFIGGVLCWLMKSESSLPDVLTWYAVLMAMSAVRAVASRRFLQRKRTVGEARRAAAILLTAAAASGFAWAYASIWLMPQDPDRQLITSLFFIAAVASAVATLSPVRNGYLAMVLPFLGPYTVWQFMLGGERTVLGYGTLLFIGVMLYTSRMYRQGVEETLRLRLANEALAQKLRAEKDLVDDSNEDLRRQIAERERIETALIAAKLDAEAANRAKSQFLANVSHELRTPMNASLGMTELLLRTQLDPGQRRFAQVAFDSGQRLLHLINDILDLSRIEAGKLRLAHVEFEPRSLVQEVIDLMSKQAADKRLALQSTIGAEVPQIIRGDPDRLRQVLVNLVSNAIKFTGRGVVAIDVRLMEPAADAAVPLHGPAGAQLRWTVSDTGIGVNAAARQRLFQPFSQGDDSTTRRFGGTGLGLAICRQVIEAMNGRIGFMSEAGRGSTFWFELAVEAVAPAARAEVRESAAPFAMLAGRVLLVEDHEVNRALLTEILGMLGLSVTVAENGSKALAVLERQSFDLTLMDWHMPDVDGLEATRRIRARERSTAHAGRRMPIVALTASVMPGDRENCLAAGMDDYISKPFTFDEIADVLQRWLPASASRVA